MAEGGVEPDPEVETQILSKKRLFSAEELTEQISLLKTPSKEEALPGTAESSKRDLTAESSKRELTPKSKEAPQPRKKQISLLKTPSKEEALPGTAESSKRDLTTKSKEAPQPRKKHSKLFGCEQQILHSLKLVLKPAAGSQLLCQEVCSMLEKMCGMEVNVRTVTYLLEKAFMEADPPVERKRIKLTD
ncbi:unnamed protein product [Porites lobata]|uniref:Uncharacterized protein n=1 Tax=Porites lobata TaxID=104759 RepID=A0ABN8RPW8_9CNID|nr:unnamed protein product [Porites lobata]